MTTTASAARRVRFRGADADLSALVWGDVDAPPLLLLHGMRDCALAFDPVAQALAAHFRVIAPDLRGHGESAHPGCYTLLHFIADVHRLCDSEQVSSAAFVGHSLGGHIAAQFAALYSERVSRLVIVEGLGPPSMDSGRVARPSDPRARMRGLVEQLGAARAHRPLAGLDDAAQRLLSNNPRLPAQEAARLAAASTRIDEHGNLLWRFDPRCDEVWSSVDHLANEQRLGWVSAPTLIVSAALAMEYWLGMRAGDERPIPSYPDAELDRKAALFPNASRLEIGGAGHMVHYDQPDEFVGVIRDFCAE